MKPHPKPGADHFTTVQSTQIWTDILQGFAELLSTTGEGARALDIGCGPGLLCRLLADRGWWAVGADNHPEMIDKARELSIGQPPDATPEYFCAALEGLPYERATFDLVCSANLLFFLADPAAGVSAMRAVCRPGGVVATLNPCPEFTVERAYGLAERRGLPEVDTKVLVNWAMLGELNGVEFDRTFGEGEVRAAFAAAGVRDVKWHEVPEAGVGGVAVGFLD